MSILFDNNASGTLSVEAAGATPGPEATTLTLQTNEGQLFPEPTGGDFFMATLEDTSGNIEIVSVTDNTADVLTVTRAQENTVSLTFAVGSKVELRTTAGTFDEFIQRTGGTMTGTLDVNGQTIQDPVITSTGAAKILGVPLRASDDGTANQIQVPAAGAAPTIGTNQIWHAGNDGPASTLDADTVDGYEGAALGKIAENETVSGDWTFNGSTTFAGTTILDDDVTTADFGTGGQVKDGSDTARPVGFNVMPIIEQDTAETFELATNGSLYHRDTAAAVDYTLPNDANIPAGATWVVVNDDTGGSAFRILGATGVTVRWFDQTNNAVTDVVAGNGFTLSDGSVATITKYTDTIYFLWGGGISVS